MAVEVSGITKQYGQQFAVDDVSFSVPRGETCGFLGPNGAGKSTTLKIITGFLRPDKGTVSIAGIDVQNEPLKAKHKIGYLAEHNPLYLGMYVKEFLHFIASIHQLNNKKESIDRVISLTGLQQEATKTIGQLSKGFRQRVGLAQALIHDPQVLILDEPLSGLDPNQLAELRALIKELGKEKTVIFSSHILQEVELVANRILMIKQGKLVLDQHQTNEQAASYYTLIRFSEELTSEQEERLFAHGPMQKKQGRYHLAGSSDEQRKQIFEFALAEQLTLLQLEERKQELATLFKEKTDHE